MLFISPAFGANDIGGVQATARLAWDCLAAGAADRGAPTELICVGCSDGSAIEPQPARSLLVSSKTRAVIGAASKTWQSSSVVVWHLGLLKLLPLLRLRRARISVFLHGIEAWRPLPYVTRRLLHTVDLILYNSHYTWERFVDANPEFRLKSRAQVHLGSLSASPPAPKLSPIRSAVMIGRMVWSENYKGHRETINAWPLVIRRLPAAELLILGGGDMAQDLERLVRELGLETYVRFLGLVSESEKYKALSRSNCLLLPSRNEGFGLVYLEAMRLGRPCLVSTVDAGREIVAPPEAGLAANLDDPEQLASAIVRLMSSGPEWDEWSARARARYEANFTAAHFQQRLTDALR